MKRLLIVALLLLSSCKAADSPQLSELTLASGGFETLGHDVARVSPMPARPVPAGSSVENIRLVAEGKAQAGFAAIDFCLLAAQGEQPFGRALPLRALAVLPEDYLQVVVRADSTITSFAALSKKRVVVGPPMVANVTANRVIDATRIDVVRVELSTSDASAALRSGDVAAIVHIGGLPSPAVTDLGIPIRVLPLPIGVEELTSRFGDIYVARTIPAGTYQSTVSVETFGIPNLYLVREDLPDKAAYQLTQLLFKARPQFDRRQAAAASPLALHPGAVRFYQESKPFAGTP